MLTLGCVAQRPKVFPQLVTAVCVEQHFKDPPYILGLVITPSLSMKKMPGLCNFQQWRK